MPLVMAKYTTFPSFDRADGRFDLAQQGSEVPHTNIITSAFHSTTRFVAQDHDELGACCFRGKFHGAELVFVLDVASYSSDEDVSDALVEDLLNGNP